MKIYHLAILVFTIVFGACTAASEKPLPAENEFTYEQTIERWRGEYETKLKAEDGWLTLAGLEWLEEGENSIGVGKEFDIHLPDRLKAGKFGVMNLESEMVTLEVENGVEASVDGKPITKTALAPDTTGKPTIVKSGDLEMLILKRNDKFGVCIRDKESPSRVNFKRLDWFPIDERYNVIADFEAFGEDRDFLVQNVLDQTVQMKSPGILNFKINGKEYSLQPALNGDGRLFIIFRDPTSKTSTYQAGRYIYTKMPEDGKVTLDFNKAENPPCAYTEFATCPLPPPQNELDIELNVGEKRFVEH